MSKGTQHPAIRPNLRCLPERVRGIPIALDILPLADDNPKARRQDQEKPNFDILHLYFLRSIFIFSFTLDFLSFKNDPIKPKKNNIPIPIKINFLFLESRNHMKK